MNAVNMATFASGFDITEVVCGMARGIDTCGMKWAEARNIPVKRFPADWKRHGKASGPIRNEEMARYADALILVWLGNSRGSADMKERAKNHGLKIHEMIVEY